MIIIFIFIFQIAHAEKKDWNSNLEGVVTRCFKSNDIKVSCEVYPDEKGKPALKDINIAAKFYDGMSYQFFYGRAIPAEMCDRHSKRINDLLNQTKQACITGDVEIELSSKDAPAKETSLHWLALETIKGEVHRNFN